MNEAFMSFLHLKWRRKTTALAPWNTICELRASTLIMFVCLAAFPHLVRLCILLWRAFVAPTSRK
jgi:hypothetical protein